MATHGLFSTLQNTGTKISSFSIFLLLLVWSSIDFILPLLIEVLDRVVFST
jgi:hypothetical protein